MGKHLHLWKRMLHSEFQIPWSNPKNWNRSNSCDLHYISPL